MYTRKQYMSGEVSHQEYYGQFSDDATVELVANYIGKDKLLASTDPNLNDIRLVIWDRAPWFGTYHLINKSLGPNVAAALSDKVCFLKAAARKWIEQNKKGS